MPCANGGWRRTRWPRSSAATRRASASASCAATTSTTPTRLTVCSSTPPASLRKPFWLLGAHAGFRLPGEAQGLTRGAVDFHAGVIRVHDNWVRNAQDTTKTSDSEAIPMTPRLTRALATLMDRSSATGNEDLVFASELRDGPVSERLIRAAFKPAQQKAGLKPIKMYNLRHSFGTTLARSRVDVRTIQALMRHDRLTTTEQYMAYRPQPELADHRSREPWTRTACPRTSRRFVRMARRPSRKERLSLLLSCDGGGDGCPRRAAVRHHASGLDERRQRALAARADRLKPASRRVLPVRQHAPLRDRAAGARRAYRHDAADSRERDPPRHEEAALEKPPHACRAAGGRR